MDSRKGFIKFMRKIFVVFLFVTLAGLYYFHDQSQINFHDEFLDGDKYSNGVLKFELPFVRNIANYKLSAELNPDLKLIEVSEQIEWINETNHKTNEILLHLYANGYKSNRTLFARQFPITEETSTSLNITKLSLDNKIYKLEYIHPDEMNPYDSTVGRISLDREVLPGDTIRIQIDYSMKIPRSIKRMGYATGRNFFFVSQWFPKVGVFENGEWICSPYYPNTNFYSDFGMYDVEIKVPVNYEVASTGVQESKIKIGDKITYVFRQQGVHDFAWAATDNIQHSERIYRRKDGSQILVEAFIQPERTEYSDRYFQAVFNSLDYFEKHIGIYPYQTVSLIDVPKTSASGGMEYPTLFTVSADLFSPIGTHYPEKLIIHEFSHQFFYGILANNEVFEAWLDEGFTSYIATKIVHHYYGDGKINFKLVKYYPINGLHFLSYNEIPLVYTLEDIEYTEGTFSLNSYYKNLSIGSIADTSFMLPDRLSYLVNSYSKPELMLLSLERYLGFDKMMEIIKDYYRRYRYRHPVSEDFIKLVQEHTKENMSWFFDNIFRNSPYFDYKIKSLQKVGKTEYEVFIERLGDGIFKNEIALYTEKDTLISHWDGSEKWKKLKFKTPHNVIGAEIDPRRINLFDINFANNSYTMEKHYWASISLAVRWFFWIQNAIMILGSVG